MSGILGIYNRNGKPVIEKLLNNMAERIVHRGPDGIKSWKDGPVGLGHLMLHTTPESLAENLPFRSADGNYVITADARLDNRDELIQKLDLKKYKDVIYTDSQLILFSYQKWGENCSAKFLGDFAFAVWDKKKQKLFSARDHFGVKPFYYYLDKNIFVFASEIKALLVHPQIPKQMNETKIADLIIGSYADKESTYYQKILRLKPATALSVSLNKKRYKTYWQLSKEQETRYKSNKEYAEAYRHLFLQAVNDRMRAAYPVGAMLSGGQDSTSIACAAAEAYKKNNLGALNTYSAVFPKNAKSDESEYIQSAVEHSGFIPHYFEADSISPLDAHQEVFQYFDGPDRPANIFINLNINKLVKKDGVRILLDGFDGDTTISHGAGLFDELLHKKKRLRFFGEAYFYTNKYQINYKKFILAYLRVYGFPFLFDNRIAESNKPLGVTGKWDTLFSHNYKKKINLEDRFNSMQIMNQVLSSEKEQHFKSLNRGVLSSTLEQLDKTAAASQIEARYPFFDRRLVEFCLGLPVEQKISRGWTRLVHRRAMQGIMPKKVQWRPGKSNLGHNFKQSLLDYEKEFIHNILIKPENPLNDFFDMKEIIELYQRFAQNKARDIEIIVLWRIVLFAFWLNHFDEL